MALPISFCLERPKAYDQCRGYQNAKCHENGSHSNSAFTSLIFRFGERGRMECQAGSGDSWGKGRGECWLSTQQLF
jgi:hypothetical protein